MLITTTAAAEEAQSGGGGRGWGGGGVRRGNVDAHEGYMITPKDRIAIHNIVAKNDPRG